MRMFLRYIRSLRGLTAYRTEWCVFAEEECLAGSIDFVATNESNEFIIIDWKRSRDLRSKFSCRFRNMRAPLHHLDDCAGVRYRLQPNCYKYILQKYYNCTVAGMRIVCAHPDNGPDV